MSRVLVADDSTVVRAVVASHLREHGHEVVEAADGEQALAAVAEHVPDVVLLDIEMPGVDGLEVLRRLKVDAATADVLVVFLTGRASTGDLVEALRLGAHDYLRKPFEGAELIARVTAALRVKGLQDELRRNVSELDALARIDALTGLYNRRHLQEQLETLHAAGEGPLSILLVDIDRFKEINDTAGHETGDQVLRYVAARIRGCVRDDAVTGRWGGEEFLVISPATSRDDAYRVGERVRRAISASPLRIRAGGGTQLLVTASVGVACGHDPPDRLVEAADQAMYRAKGAGRDRVHMANGT